MRRSRSLQTAEFEAQIRSWQGHSAAVVYSFQPETTPDKQWYDQWKSAVISSYGSALESLGIHPYYCDVRTFCRDALAGELPKLLCAFNLNAGIAPISHWALVPSVAAWCGIEPLPARAEVLIVGERKDTASLIAAACGFATPQGIDEARLSKLPAGTEVIVKPRDLGGSRGVTKTTAEQVGLLPRPWLSPAIIQEFVPGFDVTVPLVFQPTLGSHSAGVAVAYVPADPEPTKWIHDEASKIDGTGYEKLMLRVPPPLQRQILAFAEAAGLGPYARVDLRVDPGTARLDSDEFWSGRIVFLEVNPLPTLRRGINFLNVVESAPFRMIFAAELEALDRACRVAEGDLPHALVLACALSSLTTSDYSQA